MGEAMSKTERERTAALSIVRNVYVGHGKIEVLPKFVVRSMDDIAALYTPGVGYLVKEILERPEALGELTWRDNAVAVVSDGTAVLGLGKAGPRAALAVMEGKASMFKLLAGIDAIPLCLDVSNSNELVDVLKAAEPTFGGFNLEDVASPGCFEVMKKAEATLGVPIIHDDQYGTATVVAAGLMNAWKVLGRDACEQTVVVCGDGAAGTATVDMLLALGVQDIVVVGLQGIVTRDKGYESPHRMWIAQHTNPSNRHGTLLDAMKGANAFVGLSVGGIVSADMVRTMSPQPVMFAMANPVPEIMPEESFAAGAVIVATGRFDYPNQCNNVLAFPGLMRGALDTKAKRIPREVCLTAAKAIAADVSDMDLRPDNILPTPMSATLYPTVAEATAQKLVALELARIVPAPGAVAHRTRVLREIVAKRQQFLSRGV